MTKTLTEVVIETSEIFIVRRRRSGIRVWCEGCGREVDMLPIPEAALLTGHDVKTIRSMIENRNVHFSYLQPEIPGVCLSSLCLI